MNFNNYNIFAPQDWKKTALEIFKFQYQNVPIYNEFCDHLNTNPTTIKTWEEIPFLPISFFKTHTINTAPTSDILFESSGTGGNTSKHYVKDLNLYEKSFLSGLQHFYKLDKDWTILGLLPAYLERKGSSLIYMVDYLIKNSMAPESGFYLYNHKELKEKLLELKKNKKKTLLIGVSFALLDWVENHQINFPDLIVMETGGMKGRRKELIRTELHEILKKGFGVSQIHSEYGMTELLSQAYALINGRFNTPPSMQLLIRESRDPLGQFITNKTGIIHVIDFANIHSCSFIATQDLGKKHTDGSVEILGRMDTSDVRGCNLMIE